MTNMSRTCLPFPGSREFCTILECIFFLIADSEKYIKSLECLFLDHNTGSLEFHTSSSLCSWLVSFSVRSLGKNQEFMSASFCLFINKSIFRAGRRDKWLQFGKLISDFNNEQMKLFWLPQLKVLLRKIRICSTLNLTVTTPHSDWQI